MTTSTTPGERLPIAMEGKASRSGGMLAPDALTFPDDPVPVFYGFAGDHTVVGQATGWQRHKDGVISAEITLFADATVPGWESHAPSLEVMHFNVKNDDKVLTILDARPVGVALLSRANMGWPELADWEG